MTNHSGISLQFAAATDIGCRRSNNEDSFGYDTEQHLYVVCDGMGGSAAGEVASGLAVRTMIESFASSGVPGPDGDPILSIEHRLLLAILEANRRVHATALSSPKYSGMGTTMVLGCLDGSRMLVGNVGDSRAYRVRNGTCVQITLDHSLVQEQLRSGLITPEMAAKSEMQSVITRAIGVGDIVEPDFFASEMLPSDLLLLASDGLTRYAEPDAIAAIAQPDAELPDICKGLIQVAKTAGGVDNITCVVLRAVPTPLPVDQTEVASVSPST
jgi:protein phosphatase